MERYNQCRLVENYAKKNCSHFRPILVTLQLTLLCWVCAWFVAMGTQRFDYIDYPNKYMLLLRVTHFYNYLMRIYKFPRKSQLCPNNLLYFKLLINIELRSKTLLHHITLNSNTR